MTDSGLSIPQGSQTLLEEDPSGKLKGKNKCPELSRSKFIYSMGH